jgi:hypothetical protein
MSTLDYQQYIDIEKFIVGNIAPDCGEWSEDGKTLTPPKYITHWKNPKNRKESLKEEFFLKDNDFETFKRFTQIKFFPIQFHLNE